MDKWVLQILVNKIGANLLALYEYQQTVDKIIPVFILEKMDFVNLVELKKYFEGQSFIVLTRSDLENGADIFALKFIRMKKYAKLFAWTNILHSVQVKKSDLRYNLEIEIRNKLIQLREWYLSFEGGKVFLQYILPMMEVIGEWVLAMTNVFVPEDIPVLEKWKWMIEEIDKLYSCDWSIFVDLFLWKEYSDSQIPEIMSKINSYMVLLCDKIDKW